MHKRAFAVRQDRPSRGPSASTGTGLSSLCSVSSVQTEIGRLMRHILSGRSLILIVSGAMNPFIPDRIWPTVFRDTFFIPDSFLVPDLFRAPEEAPFLSCPPDPGINPGEGECVGDGKVNLTTNQFSALACGCRPNHPAVHFHYCTLCVILCCIFTTVHSIHCQEQHSKFVHFAQFC